MLSITTYPATHEFYRTNEGRARTSSINKKPAGATTLGRFPILAARSYGLFSSACMLRIPAYGDGVTTGHAVAPLVVQLMRPLGGPRTDGLRGVFAVM